MVSHKMFLISLASHYDSMCKMSMKMLIIDSLPKVSIRGLSRRHSLPNMCQNSRLPEGKQVFSINHIAFTVKPYQLGNDGDLPEIQVS